jgi:hypothetical protein
VAIQHVRDRESVVARGQSSVEVRDGLASWRKTTSDLEDCRRRVNQALTADVGGTQVEALCQQLDELGSRTLGPAWQRLV